MDEIHAHAADEPNATTLLYPIDIDIDIVVVVVVGRIYMYYSLT